MSNFIPNKIKRIIPRDPPWITKPLKTMFKKKNMPFKHFKIHGYRLHDKARLDTFRIDCQQAVEAAKLLYLTNLGNKVNDPITPQKSYWKIINRVMNKCRAHKVPTILVNNLFILNCKEKAVHFNDFFSQRRKSIINSSVLPVLNPLTDKRIGHITIQSNAIMSRIQNSNPNKASGSDGISGQMLLLCDSNF